MLLGRLCLGCPRTPPVRKQLPTCWSANEKEGRRPWQQAMLSSVFQTERPPRNGSFILWSATKMEFRAPSESRSDHRITGDALPDYQTVCGIFVRLWCAALRTLPPPVRWCDNPLTGTM